MFDWLWQFDVWGVRALNVDARQSWLDPIMLVITNTGLGQIQLAPFLAIVVNIKLNQKFHWLTWLAVMVIVGILGWRENHLILHVASFAVLAVAFYRIKPELASKVWGSVILGFLMHGILRQLFHRPRPSNFAWSNPLEPYFQDSFPSGHAFSTAAIAFCLMMNLSGLGVRVLAGVWLLLVMASRVYVGVHFPTDVLAGAGIGLMAASIVQVLKNGPVQRTIEA